jgi:5-methylthioadenosine/S-adenosylhomocysteine deaminase
MRAHPAARPLHLLLAAMLATGCAAQPDGATATAVAPAPAPVAAADTAIAVDLIVAGDHVVTMDGDRPTLSDSAVAIDDGRIVAIGSRAEIAQRYRAAETLDGRNRVVMPGMVNGHAHSAMTLMRGLADDLELMDWLRNYIFPTEVRFVDAEFVRIGTTLACWEMIRGGTTTFVDMYYYPDAVAEAVESCGLRAVIATTVIDQKSPDAADASDSLRVSTEFVRRWKGRNNRIIPILSAHSVYTVKPPQLEAVRARARELGVPVSIHLAESRFEIDYSREHYQTTPVDMLEKLGFFHGPTIGAHVIYPTDVEIPILARRKVGAIHCPTSNMKISSGVAPVTTMLAAGVPVGLGTDGAATNNDLDLWEEMRLAAFLQKVSTMDPKVVPARTALTMATVGGAAAIGLGDEIGSLTVGKRADLMQVSLGDLHFTPLYDLISHLVYVADEQDVISVVVDGKVLMREHKVQTVDVDQVRKDAEAIAARIRASLAERKASAP